MTPWSSSDAGISPQPPSPVHTMADLPGFRLSDLYYDPRSTLGPSRYVKVPLGMLGVASSIAKSSDGTRCAITGTDSIKVIRITEPPISSNLSSERPPRRSSRFLAQGPGNVIVHEDAHTRLPANVAGTDVGWGHGKYSSKIVVTCVNGDLILVDLSKSGMKIERTWKEHTRAVNAIRFTPLLNNYFATASQDGYVKLWDFRNPTESSISLGHKSPVRALTFCPLSSSPFHAVVALESGALYKWDTRKGNLGLVDRVNLAHRGPVLGMEWIGHGLDPDSKGWLCTGGMDRTVKVWDMSLPLLSQSPVHTLHTTERVKRVLWRPGHGCEVAVVPQTSMISPGGTAAGTDDPSPTAEADRIEIWDVRREWIPKYILDNGEGAVSDVIWGDSGALWASYKNGSFVQHDLRHCIRPLDSIIRSSISWDVAGSVSYATDEPTPIEIPFDDLKPNAMQHIMGREIRDKTPAEPNYSPMMQTAATVSLSAFDVPTFVQLARGYVLDNGSTLSKSDVCLLNSEVAREAGQYRVSQTWLVLNGILQTIHPRQTLGNVVPSFQASKHLVSSITVLSIGMDDNISQPIPPTGSRPRTSSFGPAARIPRSQKSSTLVMSSDHSPSTMNRRPNSHSQPPSDRVLRPQQSSAVIIRSKDGRSIDRRTSSTIESVDRLRKQSLRHSSHQVGDGALDDDSDSSEDHTTTIASPLGVLGLEEVTSFSIKSSPKTSASSRSAAPALEWLSGDTRVPEDVDPKEQELERNSRHCRNDVTNMSHSTHIAEFSDDGGSLADDNYDSSSSSGRESPTGALAPPSSPNDVRFLSLTRPRIVKQDSHSSIKTAVPRRYGGNGKDTDGDRDVRLMSSDDDMKGHPIADGDSWDDKLLGSASGGRSRSKSTLSRLSSSIKIEPTSSQQRHGLLSHLRLPLADMKQNPTSSPMDLSRNQDSQSNCPHDDIAGMPNRQEPLTSVMDPAFVREQEAEFRTTARSALLDSFRFYLNMGDVQMCAMLGTVAPNLVFQGDDISDIEMLLESYTGLLSRLRLHTSAAYIRKHGLSDTLRANTQLNTTNYTSCGKCRKALVLTQQPTSQDQDIGASIVTALQPQDKTGDNELGLMNDLRTELPPSEMGLIWGGFGYCISCRNVAARCSICRLPVKGLHFFCSVCSHGGHQRCYEEYYLRRPMIAQPDLGTFGTPGNLGWGLTAGLKPPLVVSRASTVLTQETGSWRTSVASEESNELPSQEEPSAECTPSGDMRDREGTLGGSVGLILDLSAKEKEKLRDQEYPQEREHDPLAFMKRRLSVHPCATGCGHMCWAANEHPSAR